MKIKVRNRVRKGQIFILFALMLPVMLLIAGMSIDGALLYLSKARLVRAVDGTALRLVRKFESDDNRIRELATLTMQANYPGFLSSGGEWTTSTRTDSEGNSITRHTIRGDSGEVLWYELSADDLSNVVVMTLSAQVRQRTFFMPLAGDQFKYVNFAAVATAERFPSCNMLILDISGSMRGARARALVKGVEAFMNEFVDDRDYIGVVTFSTLGRPFWPDRPQVDSNGNPTPYFFPSKFFRSGLDGDPARSVMAHIIERLRFVGITNATEGMRSGFEQVDQFLAQLPPQARRKIKVHYVFFTDGEFNTFTTMARGVGYGVRPGPDPLNPLSGADLNVVHSTSTLPDFHNNRPIVSSKFGGWNGGFVDPVTGNDLVFTNYSASPGTSYNLATLVGAVDHSTMPGVLACFSGWEFGYYSWRDIQKYDSNLSPPFRLRTGNSNASPHSLVKATNGKNGWARFPKNLSEWNNQLRDASGTVISVPNQVQIANEVWKHQFDIKIFAPWFHPRMFDSTDPNQDDYIYEAYWAGNRAYANVWGLFWHKQGLTGGIPPSATSNWGPQNGLNGIVDGFNSASVPMSHYYPEYTFGGHANYPGDTNGNGYIDGDDADWSRIGPPTHMYSYARGDWQEMAGLSRSDQVKKILFDGNWGAEVQSFIARKQHDARIFAVVLGVAHQTNVCRRMANEQSSGLPFYPDQRTGRYYFSKDGSDLTVIFRDIARRITARLAD